MEHFKIKYLGMEKCTNISFITSISKNMQYYAASQDYF